MKTHSAAFDGTLNLGIWKSEDENQDQSKKPFSCTQGASKFANPADLEMHENQKQHKTGLNATQIHKDADRKIHENQDQYKKPIQLLFMVL